jgi:uncharacterized Fe-S radical SAM superfamily protein PflX
MRCVHCDNIDARLVFYAGTKNTPDTLEIIIHHSNVSGVFLVPA